MLDNALSSSLHRVRVGNRVFSSSHVPSILDSYPRLNFVEYNNVSYSVSCEY